MCTETHQIDTDLACSDNFHTKHYNMLNTAILTPTLLGEAIKSEGGGS